MICDGRFLPLTIIRLLSVISSNPRSTLEFPVFNLLSIPYNFRTLLIESLWTKSKQRQLRARRRGHWRTRVSLGFVSVSSRASFVPLEVDARAKRVHCPCVHLVKPAADVHMDSGGTVFTCDSQTVCLLPGKQNFIQAHFRTASNMDVNELTNSLKLVFKPVYHVTYLQEYGGI